jgi:hypothetical protein
MVSISARVKQGESENSILKKSVLTQRRKEAKAREEKWRIQNLEAFSK